MRRRRLFAGFMASVLALCILLPLLIIGLWSMVSAWPFPALWPVSFSARGWRYLRESGDLQTVLRSVLLSGSAAFFSVLLSLPAAKALAQYPVAKKRWIRLLLFAPMMIPLSCIAMGVHIQFITWGLANTFAGVVLLHVFACIPYAVYLLENICGLIGQNFEEQAQTLGADFGQTLWHITLPMLMPGLLLCFGLCFIISMSQYFLTFLIGGGQVMTLAMLMFPFIQSGDRLLGSVYASVFVLITLLSLGALQYAVRLFYKNLLEGHRYV